GQVGPGGRLHDHLGDTRGCSRNTRTATGTDARRPARYPATRRRYAVSRGAAGGALKGTRPEPDAIANLEPRRTEKRGHPAAVISSAAPTSDGDRRRGH